MSRATLSCDRCGAVLGVDAVESGAEHACLSKPLGQFGKYELEIIERALKRLTDGMRTSPYIGDEDKHLLKCEALGSKVRDLIKTSART